MMVRWLRGISFATALTWSACAALSAAAGGEPAPVRTYTLEKGVFKVPLRVDENSGVERKAWPASFGVPLPEGLVKDAKSLRLLDAAGRETPCQFRVLSRYWARDNSVRWVLLDFQADVPAKGSAIYTLTNDQPAAAVADGVALEETDAAWTVSTGAIKAVVSRKRCALFESVSTGGREVVKTAEHDGPRATTEEQDFERRWGSEWNLHGWESKTKAGERPIRRAEYYGDVGAPDEAIVERSGPMHVILRIRGTYRPEKPGEGVLDFGPYNFTTRLHFYKGKDYVRVEHSVENSRFEEPRFQPRLLGHSLWTSLALDGPLACSYGALTGEPKSAKAEGAFSTWGGQDGGGVQWLDVSSGGARVGVAATLHRREQVFDLVDGRLAVRPFAVQFGQAHPISSLAEKSWGGGVSFSLDFGSRITYDYYYRFAAGDDPGTDLRALAGGMLWPLFGFAPPQWYADTAAWNMEVHPDHPGQIKRAKGEDAKAAYDPYGKDAAAKGKRGSWNFNSGGHHGNLSSLNDLTLMRGDLRDLQANYWQTSTAIDFFQWNYRGHEPTNDPEKLARAHQLILFGPKDFYIWGKSGINPGTSMCSYKYLPDFEHYAFLWLWEHYYLFGDERARESLMRFANFSVTFEWDVMFLREGEKEGVPPLERVDYFDQHHDALRRSHYARIYAWQLYTPLEAYQATGDPVYDLLTRWQLRRLSHLQRLSHGMPEAWTSWWDKDKNVGHKVDYPGEKLSDYAFAGKIWMFSKTMNSFHEAYKTYGDEEILDNIWGMCDYYRNQVPWQADKGTPQIPYVPASRKAYEKYEDYKAEKPFAYHMRTCQAYALAYHYTGDQKLKTMMEDYFKNGGWSFQAGTWGHMYYWVKAQRGGRDKLPEKIADLKCAKADRDGLVFEWTAPKAYGRSGRAARYFLKYTTKPMVQIAPSSNPDAPKDPEVTPDVGVFDERCWDPEYLKKDAWWMGTHVEGEPAPNEPGGKETCTVTVVKPHNYYGLPLEKMPRVKDLPAGKYYFGICSWDEDNNLSDLSNVVEVELK